MCALLGQKKREIRVKNKFFTHKLDMRKKQRRNGGKMQLSGIGSENHSSAHHVTKCIHDHGGGDKDSGAAGAHSAASSQVHTALQEKQDPVFSLNTLLQKLWDGARNCFGKFLGIYVEGGADSGRPGTNTAKAVPETIETLALGDEKQADGSLLHNPQLSNAASAVTPRQFVQNNPYFAAVSDTGQEKQKIWQKAKVRFQEISKHLTGQLSSKNSFHTGQQKPKQDLRRHSRYRKDDLEIECVITDDSYLMDSYNRKGAYSKLTVTAPGSAAGREPVPAHTSE